MAEQDVFELLDCEDAALLLFQKHFLCMHTLYQLDRQLQSENYGLSIAPLSIQRIKKYDTDKTRQLSEENNQALRAFYLDLNNLITATAESVAELHLDFSRRFQAWQNSDRAWSILGLEKNACWKDIQRNYRKLARESHPDKGGDADKFHEIRSAYEYLKLTHSSSSQ